MNNPDARMELYRFTDKLIEKYLEKYPQYGETWRGMTTEQLRARLNQEYMELTYKPTATNFPTPDEKSELIDVALCCFFLYTRLSEQSK